MEAKDIFEEAMEWLKAHYGDYCFFMERDIVWILQTHIISLIRNKDLPYRLFYNFEMYPENKSRKKAELQSVDEMKRKTPAKAADLVIFNDDRKIVEVAVEFKYEPSHERKYNPLQKRSKTILAHIEPTSIWHGKFPVAFFRKQQAGNGGSVEIDIERINKYIADMKAHFAYAIFIDEGRYYRGNNKPFPGSEWRDWELSNGLFRHVSVLWAQAASANVEHLQPFW